METYLTVSVRTEGESAIVEVGGELDLASAAHLGRAVELAWRGEPEQVVLELGALHFIDMAGLRTLLEAHEDAEQRGGRLVLTHLRQPVRRALALARVCGILTIRESYS